MSIASKRRSTPLLVLSSVLVLAWIVVAAFPFLWTLWGSFKVQGDFFSKADWMNAPTWTGLTVIGASPRRARRLTMYIW